MEENGKNINSGYHLFRQFNLLHSSNFRIIIK